MTAPSTQQFLEQFFDAPNLIKWGAYRSGKLSKLSFCISRLEGEQTIPTILPYMERDKTLTWFAIAFNEKSFTQLQEQIRSFIGPSYSNFSGYRMGEASHEMDSIVNTFTKGYYFTFRGDDSVIRDKLSLMFQLLDKRTGGAPRKLTDPFPILRKFNFALQANDKEEAEKQIQLLERYRLLDPRNILFIRIELLAHFERWNEIINHRQINDLIMASRPSGITESLIRSVFQVYLSRHINDVESLKTVFREEVWPQYQSLYHVRGSLAHPETLISFMLRAVDPETPQYELQHDLLVAGKGTKVESLLLALAQSGEVIKKTEIGSPSLEVAKSIADRGQFEEALAIALNLNSSVEQIQLLLLCAFEIQDFKVDKQVVDKVSHLKEEDWQSILTSRQLRVCYEYLSPYLQFSFDLDIPVRLPVNWNEWLQRYNEFGRSAALELAKRGFGEWGRTNFLHSEEERETFLKHLRRDTEAEREALPYLIRYLEKDPKWPRSEFKEVYLEIHRHLLTGMQGDYSEMKLAATWSEALVQIGLSSLQYNQLFEQLSSAWKRNASTKFLDMLYPFLETVGDHPCQDQFSCWRFIHSIRNLLKEQSAMADERWIHQEKRLIPKEWETWYSALFEATEDYEFLMDWIEGLGNDYDNWTPMASRRIQDWMTEWGVEEPESSKKNILVRSLLPFVNYVTNDQKFPIVEEAGLYEILSDIMRMYIGKSKNAMQSLFNLLNGLLLIKPEVSESQWRSTRDWLNVQPNPHLLVVVFEYMELFYDYGIPGMEIKPLWDEWMGRLYNKLDEEMNGLLPFLIQMGEEVNGNYFTIQELKTQLDREVIDEQDPLKRLPKMTITIFSCREKAAQRAADRIMLRNPDLHVRVCTHDRATDQTTTFARNSNLSIIVTSCTSHALTLGIKDHLSSEPIYPRSSGEAGIVEQLETYAKNFNFASELLE